ncbi:hypothetical protein FISHEDRAFT_70479 [Fistulina hepatica ATCC 64428]|uniref:Uncharacterized protein n=1 Tax=Fistulina hepatica ATCC 64428 TaxID=1128425 RepID=A0A0D7AIS6_9AGAR|nr:hypothetical protein FISHEDRAFT_70479 [Fistulina hepatica ATCC 64428]
MAAASDHVNGWGQSSPAAGPSGWGASGPPNDGWGNDAGPSGEGGWGGATLHDGGELGDAGQSGGDWDNEDAGDEWGSQDDRAGPSAAAGVVTQSPNEPALVASSAEVAEHADTYQSRLSSNRGSKGPSRAHSRQRSAANASVYRQSPPSARRASLPASSAVASSTLPSPNGALPEMDGIARSPSHRSRQSHENTAPPSRHSPAQPPLSQIGGANGGGRSRAASSRRAELVPRALLPGSRSPSHESPIPNTAHHISGRSRSESSTVPVNLSGNTGDPVTVVNDFHAPSIPNRGVGPSGDDAEPPLDDSGNRTSASRLTRSVHSRRSSDVGSLGQLGNPSSLGALNNNAGDIFRRHYSRRSSGAHHNLPGDAHAPEGGQHSARTHSRHSRQRSVDTSPSASSGALPSHDASRYPTSGHRSSRLVSANRIQDVDAPLDDLALVGDDNTFDRGVPLHRSVRPVAGPSQDPFVQPLLSPSTTGNSSLPSHDNVVPPNGHVPGFVTRNLHSRNGADVDVAGDYPDVLRLPSPAGVPSPRADHSHAGTSSTASSLSSSERARRRQGKRPVRVPSQRDLGNPGAEKTRPSSSHSTQAASLCKAQSRRALEGGSHRASHPRGDDGLAGRTRHSSHQHGDENPEHLVLDRDLVQDHDFVHPDGRVSAPALEAHEVPQHWQDRANIERSGLRNHNPSHSPHSSRHSPQNEGRPVLDGWEVLPAPHSHHSHDRNASSDDQQGDGGQPPIVYELECTMRHMTATAMGDTPHIGDLIRITKSPLVMQMNILRAHIASKMDIPHMEMSFGMVARITIMRHPALIIIIPTMAIPRETLNNKTKDFVRPATSFPE